MASLLNDREARIQGHTRRLGAELAAQRGAAACLERTAQQNQLREDAHLGAMFRRFMDGTELVSIFHDGDSLTVDWIDREGKRKLAAAVRIDDALTSLLGVGQAKRCNKCQEIKPIVEFGHDRNNSDGRLRRCRVCERARIAAYSRRIYRQRKAARQGPKNEPPQEDAAAQPMAAAG